MRVAKYFLCVSLLCMLCCFSVSASSEAYERKVNVTEKDADITVVLKTSANESAGLQIIKPNATFPPVSGDSEMMSQTFAYLGEVVGDEFGFAACTFNSGDTVGEYTVRSDSEIIRIEVSPDYKIFALSWPHAYASEPFMDYAYDHIYEPKWLSKTYISTSDNIKNEAVRLKELLDKDPVGKRSITIANNLCNMLLSDSEYYVYTNQGTLDSLKNDYLDAFFKEFKAIGGEVDYVWIDYEKSLSVYNMRTAENEKLGEDATTQQKNEAAYELFKTVREHSRYASEIKPLLDELGFEVCTDADKFELYNLTIPSIVANESCLIWDTAMENKLRRLINDYIYEPIKTYYPDVKFSNYGDNAGKPWYKVPSYRGVENYKGGNKITVGTHSTKASYVRPFTGAITWPEDFADDTYPLTSFNVFRYAQNAQRSSYLSNENHLIQSWVSFYNYGNAESDSDEQKAAYVSDTPYYPELIYHIAMLNPDPFLFYGPVLGNKATLEEQMELYLDDRASNFSNLLEEINSLVGYKDRVSLVDELVSWSKPYIISGMHANGKDIYRITPDISKGVTKATFCVDTETPTFSIDGETISFPNGRIITPETDIESYGYWIEMPEGEKPHIEYAQADSELFVNLEVYDLQKGVALKNDLSNDGLAVRFEVKNSSAESKDIMLIMAQYEGDCMSSLKTLTNKTFYSGEEKIVVEEIPSAEISNETTKVVFFVWDSWNGLLPYQEEYTLTKGS